MKTHLIALITLLISLHTIGQEYIRFPQLRSRSLGGATVASAGNDNPAGLSLTERMSLDLCYMNQYNIADLSYIGTSFTLPIGTLTTGAQLSYYGFGLYNEVRFGLSASHRLWKVLTLGIRINYLNVSMVNDEKPQSLLSSDIGLIYSPARWIQLGILGSNIAQTRPSNEIYQTAVPYSYRVGTEIVPDETVHILGELEKMKSEKLLARIGVEYFLLPQLPLRVGIRSNNWSPTFGVGYGFNSFTTDIVADFDTRLGISLGIGIKAEF